LATETNLFIYSNEGNKEVIFNISTVKRETSVKIVQAVYDESLTGEDVFVP